MSSSPLRVGILGAGMIATVGYGVLPGLHNIADKATVVSIADPVVERATAAAQRFGIQHVYKSLDELLAGSAIDAVINLTPIPVHGSTSLQIVRAGKHLASEKPLATSMADADAIIEEAAKAGVTVVCSPPDMLYGQYKEAKRLLDARTVGKVAFARVRSSHAGPGGGPQGWPSDPSWFYQEGSGPLFDMGVYGIHEITGLLGPARRVTAFTGITEPERVVRGGPFKGKRIRVTEDDNVLALLDFGGSTFAVVDGTFNVHASKGPKIEIFGREGTLNLYKTGNPLLEVYRQDIADSLDGWIVPEPWPASNNARFDLLHRGLLIDHLADVVAGEQDLVLSAEHARHALEIMIAIKQSSREGRAIELTTTF